MKEESDLVSPPGSGGRGSTTGSGRKKAKRSSSELFNAGCQGDADMVDLTGPNDRYAADDESVAAIASYAAVFVISVLGMHARLSRNNHDVRNKGCKLGCDQVKGQPPPPSLPLT